jgi:phage I-like protein
MIANNVNINGIPEEVKLLPLGLVKSQKGNFHVDESSYRSMRNQFKNRNIDLVVDYEHQTLENVQAPAGGWIKDLILKNDGIYAKVEWTNKAIDYLKNKEYRYLSPVVLVTKSDNKAVILHSVALTNTPAIDGMEAIINSLNNSIKGDGIMDEFDKAKKTDEISQNAELSEKMFQVAIELGLKKDSNIDEILQAIKKLKEGKTESELIANKLQNEKLQSESQELVQMSLSIGQISESQKDWAIQRCVDDVEGFRTFVNGAYKKECDNLIQMALSTGKIAPFQKQWAEQLALKDLDNFKKFVNEALPVVPTGELKYLKDDHLNKSDSSRNKNNVSALLGLSDEDVRKYGR